MSTGIVCEQRGLWVRLRRR